MKFGTETYDPNEVKASLEELLGDMQRVKDAGDDLSKIDMMLHLIDRSDRYASALRCVLAFFGAPETEGEDDDTENP